MKATLAPPSHRHSNNRYRRSVSQVAGSRCSDLDGEDDGIAESPFAMIKVLHSGWLEGHGACAACWSFRRTLGRVLNASGCFDTRFRINGRKTNPAEKLNEKNLSPQEP